MADVRITKNRWRQISGEIQQKVDQVTEMFAGMIEASAATVAPYEYGILRESIAVEGASVGALMARRRIVVGAFYGLYQHEGTKAEDGSQAIAPNPFLTDAVDYWRQPYLDAVRLAVRGGW